MGQLESKRAQLEKCVLEEIMKEDVNTARIIALQQAISTLSSVINLKSWPTSKGKATSVEPKDDPKNEPRDGDNQEAEEVICLGSKRKPQKETGDYHYMIILLPKFLQNMKGIVNHSQHLSKLQNLICFY